MRLRALARRLERLEAAIRPKSGICICKPKSVAIVDTRPEPERFGGRNDDPDEPCPRCGGKKMIIQIAYDSDWREMHKRQAENLTGIECALPSGANENL